MCVTMKKIKINKLDSKTIIESTKPKLDSIKIDED